MLMDSRVDIQTVVQMGLTIRTKDVVGLGDRDQWSISVHTAIISFESTCAQPMVDVCRSEHTSCICQLLIIESTLSDGHESSCDQPMVDDVCKSEHTSCIYSLAAIFLAASY